MVLKLHGITIKYNYIVLIGSTIANAVYTSTYLTYMLSLPVAGGFL